MNSWGTCRQNLQLASTKHISQAQGTFLEPQYITTIRFISDLLQITYCKIVLRDCIGSLFMVCNLHIEVLQTQFMRDFLVTETEWKMRNESLLHLEPYLKLSITSIIPVQCFLQTISSIARLGQCSMWTGNNRKTLRMISPPGIWLSLPK